MTTRQKTPENTAETLNQRIRRTTAESVARVIGSGPAALDARLRELEEEWDIERALEATASSFTLAGVTLAATVSRKWLLLPGVVAGFLLQHALQGWCPPLPVFRALGFRTAAEIERERYALKAARGDFRAVDELKSAHRLLAAVDR